MKIVIDIPEEEYINIKNAINSLIENGIERASMSKLCLAVLDGIPLPKNHGRLIDADELLKKAIYPFIESDMKVVTVEDIKSAPTADVKPIDRGEWIIDKHNRVAKCSVCNKISPYDYGDFCKWCGADMRKESEEEE